MSIGFSIIYPLLFCLFCRRHGLPKKEGAIFGGFFGAFLILSGCDLYPVQLAGVAVFGVCFCDSGLTAVNGV
jgi:hypothetical protein|nr:MAG TPA: hypothetical protein [Caudoviricetes sp.]